MLKTLMNDQTKVNTEESKNRKARLIAYYLPQFHPIPENDEWWGKGFTEWTNVAKAKPLYRGHHQPKLPSDLGFYDLRVPEVQQLQADYATRYGVEAFSYWHYWFGNKKTLLESIYLNMIKSKSPNFPFCLGWANESWSGVWHGNPSKILAKQEYPGKEDAVKHFYYLAEGFSDSRYFKVNGKNLFLGMKIQ
jgi:lipopolysaccharide biosynthesis protein